MLPSQIERLFDEAPAHYEEEHFRLFRDFKAGLNRGEIRAAEPDPSTKTGWRANPWVKKGILLGFALFYFVRVPFCCRHVATVADESLIMQRRSHEEIIDVGHRHALRTDPARCWRTSGRGMRYSSWI